MACVILAVLGMTLAIVTILEDPHSAAAYLPASRYAGFVRGLGGEVVTQAGAVAGARVPAGPILLIVSLFAGVTWLGGGWLVGRRRRWSYPDGLAAWGALGWLGWFVPTAWAAAYLVTASAAPGLFGYLQATSEFAISVGLALWLTSFVWLLSPTVSSALKPQASSLKPVLAMALYVVVFTAMNWGLWFNLRIPHGDSAMYEEHLWNLEHGKGFRSYLDPGLFLGEHIQVIHLFLIPLHLLWPSHLLMELCESVALASGAWFVYRIAERQCGNARAAGWLCIAYLLYAPLHFLDIEIDLKTFRPEAFGVPLLLYSLWQLEQRHWKRLAVGLVLTLLVKEDYPLVFAPLGVWIFLFGGTAGADAKPNLVKTSRWFGAGLVVVSIVYLLVTVKLVIPWFKGQEVHYASYFAKFGKSTSEVMINMLTRPGLLWNELVQARSALYATYLLVPMAGLCLLSPTRCAMGGPIFVLLCLNELAQQPPAPVHHFHAPIVPVLFWAAAAGLGALSRSERAASVFARLQTMLSGLSPGVTRVEAPYCGAALAMSCAGLTGLFIGFSPLSFKFWEPGQSHYWRDLYLPGERSRQFAKIADLIPRSARVASTDFVHPRYTHHERSYDYSAYVRAVSKFTTNVPPDTEYIVIDTRHPYSEIKSPDQVRELREHPDEWELLPDKTDGYFIVLRRRSDRPSRN
jgi:uncharacterized membrane protein